MKNSKFIKHFAICKTVVVFKCIRIHCGVQWIVNSNRFSEFVLPLFPKKRTRISYFTYRSCPTCNVIHKNQISTVKYKKRWEKGIHDVSVILRFPVHFYRFRFRILCKYGSLLLSESFKKKETYRHHLYLPVGLVVRLYPIRAFP